MSVEDNSLTTRLERLEIAIGRPANSAAREENPFRLGRRRIRRKYSAVFKSKVARTDKSGLNHNLCECPSATELNETAHLTLCPLTSTPKLKHGKTKDIKIEFDRPGPAPYQNVQCLINDCSRLNISGDASLNHQSIRHRSSRKKDVSVKEADSEKSKDKPSCSQQVLNPPCDITIDELASYFENFVHIPKKMTTMAEMMYT